MLQATLTSANPINPTHPTTVDVFIDKILVDQLTFKRAQSFTRNFYVPVEKKHQILFKSSQTWVPKSQHGSQDARKLGIGVKGLKWVNESQTVGTQFYGFHPEEDWGGKPGRWSLKSGAVQIDGRGTLWMTLHSAVPNITDSPVTVTIWIDGDQVDQLIFNSHAVQTKGYPVENAGKHRLYLTVSKTWSPYNFGSRSDQRILGIGLSDLHFKSGD